MRYAMIIKIFRRLLLFSVLATLMLLFSPPLSAWSICDLDICGTGTLTETPANDGTTERVTVYYESSYKTPFGYYKSSYQTPFGRPGYGVSCEYWFKGEYDSECYPLIDDNNNGNFYDDSTALYYAGLEKWIVSQFFGGLKMYQACNVDSGADLNDILTQSLITDVRGGERHENGVSGYTVMSVDWPRDWVCAVGAEQRKLAAFKQWCETDEDSVGHCYNTDEMECGAGCGKLEYINGRFWEVEEYRWEGSEASGFSLKQLVKQECRRGDTCEKHSLSRWCVLEGWKYKMGLEGWKYKMGLIGEDELAGSCEEGKEDYVWVNAPQSVVDFESITSADSDEIFVINKEINIKGDVVIRPINLQNGVFNWIYDVRINGIVGEDGRVPTVSSNSGNKIWITNDGPHDISFNLGPYYLGEYDLPNAGGYKLKFSGEGTPIASTVRPVIITNSTFESDTAVLTPGNSWIVVGNIFNRTGDSELPFIDLGKTNPFASGSPASNAWSVKNGITAYIREAIAEEQATGNETKRLRTALQIEGEILGLSRSDIFSTGYNTIFGNTFNSSRAISIAANSTGNAIYDNTYKTDSIEEAIDTDGEFKPEHVKIEIAGKKYDTTIHREAPNVGGEGIFERIRLKVGPRTNLIELFSKNDDGEYKSELQICWDGLNNNIPGLGCDGIFERLYPGEGVNLVDAYLYGIIPDEIRAKDIYVLASSGKYRNYNNYVWPIGLGNPSEFVKITLAIDNTDWSEYFDEIWEAQDAEMESEYASFRETLAANGIVELVENRCTAYVLPLDEANSKGFCQSIDYSYIDEMTGHNVIIYDEHDTVVGERPWTQAEIDGMSRDWNQCFDRVRNSASDDERHRECIVNEGCTFLEGNGEESNCGYFRQKNIFRPNRYTQNGRWHDGVWWYWMDYHYKICTADICGEDGGVSCKGDYYNEGNYRIPNREVLSCMKVNTCFAWNATVDDKDLRGQKICIEWDETANRCALEGKALMNRPLVYDWRDRTVHDMEAECRGLSGEEIGAHIYKYWRENAAISPLTRSEENPANIREVAAPPPEEGEVPAEDPPAPAGGEGPAAGADAEESPADDVPAEAEVPEPEEEAPQPAAESGVEGPAAGESSGGDDAAPSDGYDLGEESGEAAGGGDNSVKIYGVGGCSLSGGSGGGANILVCYLLFMGLIAARFSIKNPFQN